MRMKLFCMSSPSILLRSSALILVAALSISVVSHAQETAVPAEVADNEPVLTVKELIPQLGEENLPKQALSADLLSQLTLMFLAAYENEWSTALAQGQAAASATDDPRVARIATILAVQNNNFAEGAKLAERWLKLEPQAQDGLDLLIISLVSQGQVDAALEHLDGADKLDATAVDASVRWLAGLLIRQPNGAAAVELMDAIIKRHQESAQALLSSAYVADTFAVHDTAQLWLTQALLLQPGWEPAAQIKVGILERQNKIAERSQFVSEFVQSYPRSTQMRVIYAVDLARQEQFDLALEQLEKVLKVDARNEQALTYAAMVSQQIKETKAAKKYYRRLLEVVPDNETAAWQLAELAIEEGDYRSAEQYFEKVVSDDNYLAAQLRVATTRVHTESVDAAIDVLRNLEPATEQEYVDVALTRHYILLQAHREDEALGYINETLLYVPEDAELLYARAGAAAEIGEIEIAEEDYRLLLAMSPDDPDILNALGYTLADRTDRFAEALELIERALDLAPDSANIIDSFGWVKYKLGDLEQARRSLEKAYSMSKQPEIGIHLAEVLWKQSKNQAAVELFAEIATEHSDHPLLLSTLSRLGVQLPGQP